MIPGPKVKAVVGTSALQPCVQQLVGLDRFPLALQIHHQKSHLTDGIDPAQPGIEVDGIEHLQLIALINADVSAVKIAVALTDRPALMACCEPVGQFLLLGFGPAAMPFELVALFRVDQQSFQHAQIGEHRFAHAA